MSRRKSVQLLRQVLHKARRRIPTPIWVFLKGLIHGKDIVSISGIRLALDHDIMSNHMLEVLRSGMYERAETREISRIIQPGERIVELGAGLGFLAIAVAKLDTAASIAVYEANPKLIPLISRNQRLNGVEFQVYNQIVLPTDDAATVPFYIRKDFWASSLAPQPWGYVEQVDVPVISSAEMLRRHEPTMLVVDIEGGELELFRDISLAGVKKIYVELHQKAIGPLGMKRVFEFFSSHDFHYDQDHSHGSVVLFRRVLH